MVYFPFCKINLGLHVLAKRDDGYHNIETCFYPVPWNDVLEVLPANTVTCTLTGLTVPDSGKENLCLLAYRLLTRDFKLPPIEIHLHKTIPAGSGLGGGSSDAAAMLLALNDLFELRIASVRLAKYAAQLGSDCAFFLQQQPMIGTGRGEILTPCQVDLRGKFLVIVVPDIHVSTKEAYRGVASRMPPAPLSEILKQPASRWRGMLVNDFEIPISEKYPEIARVREKLYTTGAIYASLSGSGSALFGLFDEPCDPRKSFPGSRTWCVELG